MGKSTILYHGSRVAGLSILKPQPSQVIGGKAAVFATPDIRFALAMIHGTGDELAVDYFVNTRTGQEEMHIYELQPASLHLLEAPGYIYAVGSQGFRGDPALSHVESVKEAESLILSVRKIDDVLHELRKYNISIIAYEDVPTAMKARVA